MSSHLDHQIEIGQNLFFFLSHVESIIHKVKDNTVNIIQLLTGAEVNTEK